MLQFSEIETTTEKVKQLTEDHITWLLGVDLKAKSLLLTTRLFCIVQIASERHRHELSLPFASYVALCNLTYTGLCCFICKM